MTVDCFRRWNGNSKPAEISLDCPSAAVINSQSVKTAEAGDPRNSAWQHARRYSAGADRRHRVCPDDRCGADHDAALHGAVVGGTRKHGGRHPTQTEGLSAHIISRLTHGFSIRCLRFTSDVAVAHARLASGWRAAPLPGGRRTLWIASKSFRIYIPFSFPGLSLSQGLLDVNRSSQAEHMSWPPIARCPDGGLCARAGEGARRWWLLRLRKLVRNRACCKIRRADTAANHGIIGILP